jgi:hypothetical protein
MALRGERLRPYCVRAATVIPGNQFLPSGAVVSEVFVESIVLLASRAQARRAADADLRPPAIRRKPAGLLMPGKAAQPDFRLRGPTF